MPRRPTHVLVPTDFSRTAQAALDYALDLCELVGARLTLLHVTNRAKVEEELKGLDSLGYLFQTTESMASGTEVKPASLQWARLEEVARRQLEQSVDPARRGKLPIEFTCRDGYPSQTITQYAQEHGVDLIVMGTQGRGRTAQFVMGSVTQNVIRSADCPVLTVKAEGEADKTVC
jgi:nucleotide-binding universal stress UspA family protein